MQPTILVADDDEDIRLALNLLLNAEGYLVAETTNPKDTLCFCQRTPPSALILDLNFSRDTTSGEEGFALLPQIVAMNIPVILMTAWGSVELAVAGLKQGAQDFIEKPWQKDKLLASLQQAVWSAANKGIAQNKQHTTTGESASESAWVYESSAMQAVEQLVQQTASSDANILILGENGTGKSQLAKRIHHHSSRLEQAFVSVNMAAIPENLFESELFGHEKGAFTDAKQSREGRFQLANKGTLFLDEIAILPESLQAKLLRVLESKEFEAVGSSQTQISNARIISATNANIQQQIKNGKLRQDLLYRLNTITITLPPLRERRADILLLAQHFLTMFSDKYQKSAMSFSKQACNKLEGHLWPGNIRELSHVIERSVLICPDNEIDVQHILLDSDQSENDSITVQPLEQAEVTLIKKALAQTQGNVIEAAALLSISRNALYRRLEKYNISYEA